MTAIDHTQHVHDLIEVLQPDADTVALLQVVVARARPRDEHNALITRIIGGSYRAGTRDAWTAFLPDCARIAGLDVDANPHLLEHAWLFVVLPAEVHGELEHYLLTRTAVGVPAELHTAAAARALLGVAPP